MTEFAVMADWRRRQRGADELVDLSVRLAGTPCGPLRTGLGFPDREVAAIVGAVLER